MGLGLGLGLGLMDYDVQGEGNRGHSYGTSGPFGMADGGPFEFMTLLQ
jgi:hypothetical protein